MVRTNLRAKVFSLAASAAMACFLIPAMTETAYAYDDGRVVGISKESFPDQTFRNFVSENFDTDGDGYLNEDEISRTTEINIRRQGIYSIQGVEYFTELETLYAGLNYFSGELDLSNNTKLKDIEIVGRSDIGYGYSSINLSSCTELETLTLNQNKLTSLDVSNNVKLTDLRVSSNELTSLDLSNNTLLTSFYCVGNLMASLDLSSNTLIEDLECYSNRTTYTLAPDDYIIDLSTIEGFDISKVSSWEGGTVSGSILTVDKTARSVLYTYDLGNGSSANFIFYFTKPYRIELSNTSYTYNGEVKSPTLTIEDTMENILVEGTDYTVSVPSGRKKVGTYTYQITFIGDYIGSYEVSFKIKPVKTSISKLTKDKKAFTVKWSKKTTQVTGYQIQYSTSSKFTESKTKSTTVKSYNTTSKKISKLKSKKKYYVRIRTYKSVNGKKYYSSWSDIKSVTTK